MLSNPARPLWLGVTLAVAVIVFAEAIGGTVDAALIVSASLALFIGGLIGRRAQGPVLQQSEAGPPRRHTIAEALLANIPDPVILVDRRVVVMEANPAARRLLPGLKLRHPLSFSLRAPDVLDGIEEVLRTGSAVRTEYATRVPTERAFEVQIGALPMSDMPGSGEANVVLFLRDLTEARRLEAMRVDFVANASHELRTPLASILGFIETLRDEAGEDADVRARFLKVMDDEARRMQRLVEDLISLSRIEAEKFRLPDSAVDLAQLVADVCAEVSDAAGDRGLDLVATLDPRLAPVSGDKAQLSQMLHNLIGNAMKYGRAGTPVSIDLKRDDLNMIRLSIRDEGDGIAAVHIPRLTERFYRADAGRSRSLGGTGLGLAIVKHIVERHRGRLDIASQVGVGTTVSVILPPSGGAAKGSVIKG